MSIAEFTAHIWFCPECGLRDETARGIDQDGTCSSCGATVCTWDSLRGHLSHYGWEVVSVAHAEQLAQARALLEHWFHGRGYIGEETIDAVTQAFLARAPAQAAPQEWSSRCGRPPSWCRPGALCTTCSRLEQLEKQAALYDQECGMCGSTADELVEFMEWKESRAPAQTAPRTTALLCYEGDCAKMTGRARPCPVHDAPAQTAPRCSELEEEEIDQLKRDLALAQPVFSRRQLQEQLTQARALLGQCTAVMGQRPMTEAVQAFLSRAPAESAEHDYVDPMLSGYAAQTAEPPGWCGCQRAMVNERRAESAEATLAAVARAVDFIASDVAAARKNREPHTGMHVPYHGDFAGANPSVVRDLERMVRHLQDLLRARKGGGNG